MCSNFKLIDTPCFYFTTVHCHLSAGKHLCYWPWPTWSSFPCVARHSWYLLSDLASCLCWSIFICLQKLKISISKLKMENSKKKNGNKNPYIESMNEDVLYHIGLSSGSQDLKAMFGDIKVCITLGTVICFFNQNIAWKHNLDNFAQKSSIFEA